MIKSVKVYNKDKKRVKEVIRFVKEKGGLAYAETKMHAYKERALAILDRHPDSPYKSSLRELVVYVVERKK